MGSKELNIVMSGKSLWCNDLSCGLMAAPQAWITNQAEMSVSKGIWEDVGDRVKLNAPVPSSVGSKSHQSNLKKETKKAILGQGLWMK